MFISVSIDYICLFACLLIAKTEVKVHMLKVNLYSAFLSQTYNAQWLYIIMLDVVYDYCDVGLL